MRTLHFLISAVVAVTVVGEVANSGEKREVRGRVLDESGRPVARAAVAYSWRANGPPSDKHGKPYNLESDEAQKAFWGNLGKMYPWGESPAETGSDGRFVIAVPETCHHLMAMDESRARGGLAILPKGDGKTDTEIHLGPLVRVKGSIEGPAAGERPEWTHVYTMLPDDPARPLDMTRLVSCGSFEARFEMSLPAGRYLLNAYTYDDKRGTKADVVPDKELSLTSKSGEVDLGVLRLSPFKPTITKRKKRAQEAGTWDDYTQHYGEPPPRWNVVEARGVKKDVQISDFKGKWVLVDFWGLSCNVCLRTGIPTLIKFYDEHQAQRDRFEILAICIDEDGDLKTLAELDKKLLPVVKNVWGKPIPFPVLLDPTFKTWERYGLSGLGTVILIDPDGNLVEGDETTLADKLAGEEPGSNKK